MSRARAPSGSTPSWFTPLAWWLELEQRLLARGLIPRPFDCDPCGHPEAPVSREILRRGGTVYAEEDDGLSQPWPLGSVAWVNFPYDSPTATLYLEAMARARDYRSCTTVALAPAWTDRAWWQRHVEPDRQAGRALVEFQRGRMRFGWPGNPDAAGADTATFPSAVVVWRVPKVPKVGRPRKAGDVAGEVDLQLQLQPWLGRDGAIRAAAEVLGLSRRTVYRRLAELTICDHM